LDQREKRISPAEKGVERVPVCKFVHFKAVPQDRLYRYIQRCAVDFLASVFLHVITFSSSTSSDHPFLLRKIDRFFYRRI